MEKLNLFPNPRSLERGDGCCPKSTEAEIHIGVEGLPSQGFRIEISEQGIDIEAADLRGAFYARGLLEQMRTNVSGEVLPCLSLEDWPEFEVRGYMLDISRDRVLTMSSLYDLVDLLALLRYNQLQLYTEHTFAYRDHKVVWDTASPMTSEEIQALDLYCQDRYIELVPNQNSFGHVERWLRHEAYRYLAECPDGFEHPLLGRREFGSVLRPEPASLDFLDGLYSELLPKFSSRKFNIGGDEPWELGQGVSRERVEREGKSAVYLDFLAKVCELAERHGAEPMCWADILLEDPDSISELPAGITPVLWGYEADHPFEEQCNLLASLGRPFYIAPGDSTWNSHTGRAQNRTGNIAAAVEAGRKFGAAGILLTHWGDGGHPQPRVVALSGLIESGLSAWNIDGASEYVECAIEGCLQLMGAPLQLASLILRTATLDDALDCPLVNKSYLAESLRLSDHELGELEPRPSLTALNEQIGLCDSLLTDLDLLSDTHLYLDELTLAIRMNRFAAYRCLDRRSECPDSADELIAGFRETWLRSSRPGGLEDSVAKLKGLACS